MNLQVVQPLHVDLDPLEDQVHHVDPVVRSVQMVLEVQVVLSPQIVPGFHLVQDLLLVRVFLWLLEVLVEQLHREVLLVLEVQCLQVVLEFQVFLAVHYHLSDQALLVDPVDLEVLVVLEFRPVQMVQVVLSIRVDLRVQVIQVLLAVLWKESDYPIYGKIMTATNLMRFLFE